MTDKELIQAFRECEEHPGCIDCPVAHDIGDCIAIREFSPDALIPRLEALLAENEHLREATKMIPKWRPVSEPPKEDGRYLCSVMSLVSNGRNYADILKWDKDGFRDGHIYTDLVTHWMPLPSTEGME